MGVIAELHVLCKPYPLHDRNVADIKEPDVGQHAAFEDEPSDDATKDVNVDFGVGGRVDKGQL